MTSRDDAIKRIRTALKNRSGKPWSVTGGRGTAWGWIRIQAAPKDCRYEWDGVTLAAPGSEGYPSIEQRRELSTLLGKTDLIHPQGESIPASSAYYTEYIDRAEGRTPSVLGKPYWD